MRKQYLLIGKKISIPSFGECEPDIIEINNESRHIQSEGQHIRATSYNLRKRGFSENDALKMASEQVKKLRAIKYKNPHELTIDECKLIGFWLGDGTKSNGRVSMAQSEKYLDNIAIVDGLFEKTGIHCTKPIS